MSKAEDLAKELYPDWKMTDVPTVDGIEGSMVRIQRVAYIKGYHQAEKDLELTWEDVKTIFLLVQVEWRPNKNEEEIYQEVLKRFNKEKRNMINQCLNRGFY